MRKFARTFGNISTKVRENKIQNLANFVLISFNQNCRLTLWSHITLFPEVDVPIFVSTGPRCDKPLGLQNGRVRSSQFSASSSWNAHHGPSNARLHWRKSRGRTGAWSARYNNRYQWVQVDFGRATRVTKIATQGRQDARQWVRQYYLSYSQDGGHFAEFKEKSSRKVGICPFVVVFRVYFRAYGRSTIGRWVQVRVIVN